MTADNALAGCPPLISDVGAIFSATSDGSDRRCERSEIERLTPSVLRVHWRHFLMVAIVAGSLALMLSQRPFGQDPAYHDFADRRTFLGIPNFFDVTSNLAFLLVGIAGLRISLRNRLDRSRNAWVALFAGVTLVSVGSAYYHWDPSNQTLLWDRLPITIGFMGLFAALLGEYIGERLGMLLLVPALILGFASVVYWHKFDDLRFYDHPGRNGPVPCQIFTPVAAPRGPGLVRAREDFRGQRWTDSGLEPGRDQRPYA